MPIDAQQYPQLALMQSVQQQSEAIGQFLDWLSENGMAICQPEDGLRGSRFAPIMETPEQLLARHFQVDLAAVERERRHVLAQVAAAQAANP